MEAKLDNFLDQFGSPWKEFLFFVVMGVASVVCLCLCVTIIDGCYYLWSLLPTALAAKIGQIAYIVSEIGICMWCAMLFCVGVGVSLIVGLILSGDTHPSN